MKEEITLDASNPTSYKSINFNALNFSFTFGIVNIWNFDIKCLTVVKFLIFEQS